MNIVAAAPILRELRVEVYEEGPIRGDLWSYPNGWVDELRSLRLRGPFPLFRHIEAHVGEYLRLRVRMLVPDRDAPNEMIPLYMTDCHSHIVADCASPERLVRSLLHRAVLHELDESIYANEKRPFDPHRGERAKETTDARREAG